MAEAVEARSVGSSRGTAWLLEGFELFRKAPGTWVGIFLIWCVIQAVLGESLGSFSSSVVGLFVGPIFSAGLLTGASSLARGDGLRVEHLFAGFRSRELGALLMLGVLRIGLYFVVGLVCVLTVGGSIKAILSMDFSEVGILTALLALLVGLALAIPIEMMGWFAPALIVFHKMPAWMAMKTSLQGCLRNMWPFLLYGLIALVLLFAGALPLGLGLLVVGPILFASMFTSYRDIFR